MRPALLTCATSPVHGEAESRGVYLAKQYVLLHDRICGSTLSRADGYLFGLDYMATFAQGNLHMTAALAFQRHSCDRAARRLPVLFL
jgi:hypothetical protein